MKMYSFSNKSYGLSYTVMAENEVEAMEYVIEYVKKSEGRDLAMKVLVDMFNVEIFEKGKVLETEYS